MNGASLLRAYQLTHLCYRADCGYVQICGASYTQANSDDEDDGEDAEDVEDADTAEPETVSATAKNGSAVEPCIDGCARFQLQSNSLAATKV